MKKLKAKFTLKSSASVKRSSKSDAPSVPRIAVAIMAAGKGTRLKSQIPKVLHEVGGRPVLEHVIRAAARVVQANDVFAIIGHEAECHRSLRRCAHDQRLHH
ncbi:MAG: NTP transferase domain-containing protein [Acidobacteriales bacterium]|nr:NTP transferase domain-containing protein [Terriglobales bacterium]